MFRTSTAILSAPRRLLGATLSALASLALVSLTLASPALERPARASDHNGQEHSYGGPVQTWCDVNPDCNGWSKGLHRASYESGATGSTASPTQKQRLTRRHGHADKNR
jgi:hypothetical protein